MSSATTKEQPLIVRHGTVVAKENRFGIVHSILPCKNFAEFFTTIETPNRLVIVYWAVLDSGVESQSEYPAKTIGRDKAMILRNQEGLREAKSALYVTKCHLSELRIVPKNEIPARIVWSYTK